MREEFTGNGFRIEQELPPFRLGVVGSTGWRNEGKNYTAPLNKPYYDTNTALFPSFTLSMHMFAISH